MARSRYDFDMDIDDYGYDDDLHVTQESYDAASAPYSDLFDAKFNSFDPATIAGGNNKLKSGVFDMDVEDSDLKIGYRNSGPAMSPKPGRFFD